eukprot:15336859-Ditylum_brightwellii.AAC.1
MAADIIKCTKEVAVHHVTKTAKKIEEVVNPTDTNSIEMAKDDDEIVTTMADDTVLMLSLQSEDKNDEDHGWMREKKIFVEPVKN